MNAYKKMIMRLLFETDKDVDLVLEPWGHVEALKKGQRVSFEYEQMFDSAGNELWPLVSLQDDGSVLIDLPSIALRAYVDDTLFYECWD